MPASTAHGRRRTRPIAAAMAALAIHVSAAGGREGVLEGDVGIRLARVERVAGDPVGGRPRGGDGQQGGHGGCGGWARRAHAAAVPAWPAGPSPTGPGRSIASARYAPVTSHAAR